MDLGGFKQEPQGQPAGDILSVSVPCKTKGPEGGSLRFYVNISKDCLKDKETFAATLSYLSQYFEIDEWKGRKSGSDKF